MVMLKEEIAMTKEEMKGGTCSGMVTLILIVFLLCAFGCVPLVTGIKTYKSGDTQIDFITGVDIGASASGTDTLDNNKGIKPKS